MTEYQPDQRAVACRILTFAGWVEGKLHVPVKTPLVDYLNRGEALFRLTEARLPEQTERHGFFALERGAVILVVPLDPAEQPPPGRAASQRDHAVSWLLPSGSIVEGTLSLLEGVRVSDHLMHRTGFVVLRRATLYYRLPDGSASVEPSIPWVALQANRAVGASEIE